MMNRNLLQRQMFKGGGMIPQYYQDGGPAGKDDPTIFDPNNILNIARF